jgi:bla regulator protein blaR1
MTNHLWQSTVFAMVAGILTLAFRKNRAQVRYWLWFSASVKFFVPFSFLMMLGSRVPAASEIAAPAVSIAIEQVAEPFPETVSFRPLIQDRRDWLPVAIPVVWACGLAAIAMIRFRGWLRIRAAVRTSVAIDIPAAVEIRSSPGLLEPGVVGLFRPVLLVPEGIAERLTPRQLEAVLAHELCHVRRRDNLTSAIHMIVEALFWFHPLVWWIGARLVEERERACDEGVLSMGGEPQVYAEAILNVCKLYVESPLVCVSGVTGADLKKRIEAIMMNRMVVRLNFAKKAALAVAGMAALAAPIVVGVMNTPRLRAQTAAVAVAPVVIEAPAKPVEVPQVAVKQQAAPKSVAPQNVAQNAAPTPRVEVQTVPVPAFEVASIKLCTGDSGGRGRSGGGAGDQGPSPDRLSMNCQTVKNFIRMAYVVYGTGHFNPLDRMPIEGGPGWIDSDRYQITAKAEGAPGQDMMRGLMLQALLEDRLKLKVRRETREVPAYALTVGKNPKLKPSEEGSCVVLDFSKPPAFVPGEKPPVPCGLAMRKRGGQGVKWEVHGASLDELARALGTDLDRIVINKTGIAGRFDFYLEFAPDETTAGLNSLRGPDGPVFTPGSASDPAGGPSIFTAIQEQLGLKLEAAKGPREFLVIDRVERPTEN